MFIYEDDCWVKACWWVSCRSFGLCPAVRSHSPLEKDTVVKEQVHEAYDVVYSTTLGSPKVDDSCDNRAFRPRLLCCSLEELAHSHSDYGKTGVENILV